MIPQKYVIIKDSFIGFSVLSIHRTNTLRARFKDFTPTPLYTHKDYFVAWGIYYL